MIEAFLEETVLDVNKNKNLKKYKFFNTIMVIFIILLILYACFVVSFVPLSWTIIFTGILPLILLGLSAFFSAKFRDMYCVDYDYVFVSGDVKIIKVINDRKNRLAANFRCVDLERIGKYDSPTFKKYLLMPNNKVYYMTSNELPSNNNDFYYVVFNTKDEKRIIVLECSKKFISYIIYSSNRTILEEGFKILWFI